MTRFTLFLLLTAVGFTACKHEKAPVTPSEKATASIEKYMSADRIYGTGYHAVSFGIPDSTFTAPDADSTNYYLDKANYYIDLATDQLPTNYDKSGLYSDSSIYFSKKARAYLDSFKPEFNGWKVTHAFQSKDSVEAVSGRNVVVYLDTAFQVVRVEK